MVGFFVSCTMPLAGIDIGGTYIKYGLVEESGKILHQERVQTRAEEGRDAVLQRIIQAARTLSALSSPPSAFGIGVPGVVNQGIVHSPPNLPGWDEVPLQQILEDALGSRVVVENDANAAALAESRFGAGRDHPDFLYVTLGTGVGGGIVLNNELYRGPHGDAGEIGHIQVAKSEVSKSEVRSQGPGPKTRDPRAFRENVLESFIGSQILEAQWGMPVGECDKHARAGDEQALGRLQDVGELLGLGLCSALAVLGLRVVVLGGGIAQSDFIINAARETVKRRAIPTIASSVKILKAAYVQDTGLIGAAFLSC